MRRHKWKLLAALAGLVVLAGAAAFALWPDRITPENYARIRIGISQAEVEAILGPPGDYRTVLTQEPPRPDLKRLGHPSGYEVWVGDTGHFLVFYSHDVVSHKTLFPAVAAEQTPLDNLFWRAKRQWRKWFP